MADKNTNTLTKRILNNLQCVGSVKKAKVGHLLSNPCHGNLIQFFFFPQFEPDQNTTNFYRPFQEAAHVILCLFMRELKTYSRESDDIYWAKMLIKIMIFFFGESELQPELFHRVDGPWNFWKILPTWKELGSLQY